MTSWASFWDGRERAPLRVGIAVIAAASQAVEAYQVDWQSRDAARYPPSGELPRALATIPGAAWVLLTVVLVGLVAVARGRRPILGGAVALLAAGVLSQWQTQIFGSPSRNAFFPGAVLFGWVLGHVWAANLRSDGALRERLAEAGAVGCLAAAYVGSALSKLLSSGWAWVDGAQVRALVLQQQPLARWAWLHEARAAIVDNQEVAVAASIATLVIEGGAFLLLFGPRLRLVWGLLLLGLHVTITLLNTMPYLGASLLLALFCLPWRRRARVDEPERARLPAPVAVLLVCIVVAAWAAAPWGWRGAG